MNIILKKYTPTKERLTIFYSFVTTSFGECLIGTAQNDICYLSFVNQSHELSLQQLCSSWSEADILEDRAAGVKIVQEIFSEQQKAWSLLVKGTPFQYKVWQALCEIPCGNLVSYEQVAVRIGQPTAYRATARAIGSNNISYLIPCHRVVRKSGDLCGYRWGLEHKKRFIDFEKNYLNKSISKK